MIEVRKLCEEQIGKELYQIIISNPKSGADISKVKIRPIMLKNSIVFQVTEYKGAQVFHGNYEKSSLIDKIEEYLKDSFKQMELTAAFMQATVLISKNRKRGKKKKNPESTG